MSYDETGNYQLRKPKVSNDWGEWGYNLNHNADLIDALLKSAMRGQAIFRIGTISATEKVFGDEGVIDTAVVPVAADYAVGTSRLIFSVSNGSGTMTVSGTAVNQNTLNELQVEEVFDVESGKLYITRNYYTDDVTVDCPGVTMDISVFRGFSLDKNVKMNKIVLEGSCDQVVCNLTAELLVYDIVGNSVTVESITDMGIDKTLSGGAYFSWKRELSISKELIRGRRELALKLASTDPGSWHNVSVSIFWE